ncbi:MAG: ribonuclease T2 [Rhodobacteraceae bacterium]|nr:ribonuclease T2 [Paracoccaceae bacterium]
MIKSFCCAAFLALSATPVFAGSDPAGEFDYYVLALSWTPSWCEEAGDTRNAPQCENNAGYGFAVHGLWPQYEAGWPSYCRTGARDPTRGQTNAMADLMGSGGSAWYQWKKHGRCAGLPADEYFDTVRAAYGAVNRPDVFRNLPDGIALPASVVEAAFLEANPDMVADGVTVTCKESRIQEVRICLNKDLSPRACGADTLRDCTLQDAVMDPIR